MGFPRLTLCESSCARVVVCASRRVCESSFVRVEFLAGPALHGQIVRVGFVCEPSCVRVAVCESRRLCEPGRPSNNGAKRHAWAKRHVWTKRHVGATQHVWTKRHVFGETACLGEKTCFGRNDMFWTKRHVGRNDIWETRRLNGATFFGEATPPTYDSTTCHVDTHQRRRRHTRRFGNTPVRQRAGSATYNSDEILIGGGTTRDDSATHRVGTQPRTGLGL